MSDTKAVQQRWGDDEFEDEASSTSKPADEKVSESVNLASLSIVDDTTSNLDKKEESDIKATLEKSNRAISSMADTKTVRRRWGDEEPDDEACSTSKPADEKVSKSVNLDSLSMVDDTTSYLDEPDESDIKAVTTGDTLYASATSFEELKLTPELLRGLYVEMNFQRPSKIQAVSLPMILTPPYKNLIAQAHNGSGKTTCFVLGMLSRVDPMKRVPQALCVCPTRELAIQNREVLLRMAKYTGITSMLAVPTGTPAAKHEIVNEQVVIGTPGTMKRLVSTKKLSTRYIKILVFDEADHMLAEDGFKDDSERIMKDIERNTADGCQVLLFSATFNETVKSFASRVVKDANQLFVKKEELSLDAIKQYKVRCPDEIAKLEVVRDKIFLLAEKLGQTIIFVRSRDSARRLHDTLEKEGYECTSIQGALQQDDRDRIIKEFRSGLTKVLISTDVLARGFDQPQVNLIVNYDLPVNHSSPSEPDCEVYLHRIGRAGRFGRKGAVFNLLCHDRDKMIMEKIEKHFDHPVKEVPSWNREEDFEAALKEAGLA